MKSRPLTFDEAELRLRRLLAHEGFDQPDEVQRDPGSSEITFVWEGHDPVTVDLAEFPETEHEIEVRGDQGAQASYGEVVARMSMLVADAGMRKPDAVRAGPEPYEVSFIWVDEKVLVIVDSREEIEQRLDLGANGRIMV